MSLLTTATTSTSLTPRDQKAPEVRSHRKCRRSLHTYATFSQISLKGEQSTVPLDWTHYRPLILVCSRGSMCFKQGRTEGRVLRTEMWLTSCPHLPKQPA